MAFHNEKLNEARKKWSSYEQELYGFENMGKLPNSKRIYSDHQSLGYFKNQKHINKMHARWVAYFEQFAYLIKHKFRANNRVVDALSRRATLLVYLED